MISYNVYRKFKIGGAVWHHVVNNSWKFHVVKRTKTTELQSWLMKATCIMSTCRKRWCAKIYLDHTQIKTTIKNETRNIEKNRPLNETYSIWQLVKDKWIQYTKPSFCQIQLNTSKERFCKISLYIQENMVFGNC